MGSVNLMRPTSALGTLVSLSLLLLATGLGVALTPRPIIGILMGAGLFLIYRVFIVRELLCHLHRRGIRLSREERYEEALDAFARSEDFWTRHGLLDRWRWVLLASSGPYPFVTLAQYNQAWCLARLRRTDEAIIALRRLEESGALMPMANALHEALQSGWRGGTTGDHLGSSWPDAAMTPVSGPIGPA